MQINPIAWDKDPLSSDPGAHCSSAETHFYTISAEDSALCQLLSHATILQAHWVLDLTCAPSLDKEVI